MITTAQLAKECKVGQRAIQNRILRLGLKLSKIGNAFYCTPKQAELIRNYPKAQSVTQPARLSK